MVKVSENLFYLDLSESEYFIIFDLLKYLHINRNRIWRSWKCVFYFHLSLLTNSQTLVLCPVLKRNASKSLIITITIYLDLSTWSNFYQWGHTHYPVSTFPENIVEIVEKKKYQMNKKCFHTKQDISTSTPIPRFGQFSLTTQHLFKCLQMYQIYKTPQILILPISTLENTQHSL